MSAPAGYIQLPSGFWVGPDGSGPYFVNVATGAAQAVGGVVSLTAVQVAALKAAGTPVAPGTIIIDPSSPYSVLGVVDGAGNLAGRRQLLSTGVRFVLPSSGSVGANGALTLTTALPATFAKAFMYFPAGAVFSGSAAGRYYVVMSSTTAGTIYTDTYTSGVPSYPSSPTSVVGAGPGAYTQTTGAQIAMVTLTLPGGTLGANGKLIVSKMGSVANTAGNKVPESALAGSTFASYTFTTSTMYRAVDEMQNMSSESAQTGNNFVAFGTQNSSSLVRRTVNTAVDQSITVQNSIATATDWITIESLLIESVFAA